MRTLTVLVLLAMMAAPAFSQYQTPQPSTIPKESNPVEREVREELNQASADYKAGRFAEAQQHLERALILDPSNKAAPIFIARIIHQQYKPGDNRPENIEKARAAIGAYQRILTYEPDNEEAYKAVAALYTSIHEEQLLRDWILQRALSPLFPADKRAEAYAVLAGKDWDCSFKITELPESKLTEMKSGQLVVIFKKPASELDFQKAKQCTTNGLEMVEVAITLDWNLEAAWVYKQALMIEKAKLAEMEFQSEAKTLFLKEADEAGRQAKLLADKHKRVSQDSSAQQGAQPPPPPRINAEPAGEIANSLPGKMILGGDLDDAAVVKPTPPYPPIAKAAHASGLVKVEIVVDELGRVIAAHAISGHPLLQAAAVAAARAARFSPTSLDGQPVKLKGFLTYKFGDQ